MTNDIFIPMPVFPVTPAALEPGIMLDPALKRRAERLWPDSLPHAQHNRAAWLRSVLQLRRTRGWVLDPGTAAPNWHANPVFN